MLDVLTLETVRAAADRIAPHVLRTPAMPLSLGATTLWLKPESLQATGAFKIRGAFSLMTTLEGAVRGVVAHSSGNHAQAVARAAKVLGLPATIVMPEDAPPIKRTRTEADGARIVTVSTDSDERVRRAAEIAEAEGLVPVPPYDHPLVAAGQGTCALELLEDVATPLDRFYAPVSGGGLLAGCATVLAALSPSTELVAVEPEDAADTRLSLQAGRRVKVDPPKTIADGLRVRTPGAQTFEVTRRYTSRVELVSDDELLDTMAFALSELRLVLEPSGAASLAVARREAGSPGTAGVVLTGGNVGAEHLARAVAAGG